MNGPCVLALLFVAMFSVSEAKKNVVVPFKNAPNDGAACTGYEGGSQNGGSGPRTFTVKCTVTNGQNYNCVYKGNPHDCAAYNKNQQAYYACLADEAAENAATGCAHGTLTCDTGKFKKCDHVSFKK